MKMQDSKRTDGLILLVVLAMLTLFSLLSITYVVFSSQSRSAAMGRARKDFRGTPPATLLDEAVRQVVRGTDARSALWKHDLLGDLYGSGVAPYIPSPIPAGTFKKVVDDRALAIFGRTLKRDNEARSERIAANWLHPWPLTVAPAAGAFEAPSLLPNSKIVNIPLNWIEDLPEQHDALNGRVLTFRGGPLSGYSFRVLKYVGQIVPQPLPPMPTAAQILNERVRQSIQYSITVDLSSLDRPGFNGFFASSSAIYDLFFSTSGGIAVAYGMLLNAAPLNALGLGLNSADSAVQTIGTSAVAPRTITFATSVQIPVGSVYDDIATSILPNYSYTAAANSGFTVAGAADEDYDSPDFANFLLGYQHTNSAGQNSSDIIPSLHRPAVINFIYSKVISAKGNLASLQAIDLLCLIELFQRASGRPLSFRITNLNSGPAGPPVPPIVSQNAGFSGSNNGDYPSKIHELDLNFANWTTTTVEQDKFEAWVRWLTNGPWDVDNTGDGLNDSLWVDIATPLMTSPEGKLLKLMAAYYVEDMGGRLDLNATGNRAQADQATYSGFAAGTESAFRNGGNLVQGNGYGTADISLRHLFANDQQYWRFIAERAGAPISTPVASLIGFGPGVDGFAVNDPLSQLHERRRGNHDYRKLPGFPMSVFGKSGMEIDLFGNPRVYDNTNTNEVNDDPYEAHLNSGYRDSLISIAEWERIYRATDWDRTTLPGRLERLMGTASVSAVTPVTSSLVASRASMTYNVHRMREGSPAMPAPPDIEEVTRRVGSFSELLEALVQKRVPSLVPPGTLLPILKEKAARQLLPLEFLQNLPLDPNRPFGNGLDDNGNGFIDEPSEINRAEYPGYPGNNSGISEFYEVGDGVFDTGFESLASSAFIRNTYGGLQSRQLLARHLYCLAQLILSDDYIFPNRSVAYAYGDPERARILAQWAVNVVDFRDSDAVMTRFPYDSTPWTEKSGEFWVPTGGVVFGQEQPELLLTETLAFHDLRISQKANPPAMGNPKHQMRIPEGSLFLELMCTRSGGNTSQLQGVPRGNLYALSGTTPVLNVAAVTPVDEANVRFPVWRIAILDPSTTPTESVYTKFLDAANQPKMHYQLATNAGLLWSTDTTANPVPKVNRIVWLANLSPAAGNVAQTGVTESEIFYNRTTDPALLPRLQGGQYLVVGPRDVTYLGQRTQTASPPLHRPSPQRIELLDTVNAGWVQIWNDENFAGLWPANNRPTQVPAMEPIPSPSNYLSNCLTMVAAADRPAAWTTVPGPIGLNISEPQPKAYYPEPTAQLNSDDNGTDAVTGADGFQNLPRDAYVDLKVSPGTNSPQEPLDATLPSSLLTGWEQDGDTNPTPKSQENWSTALLQRLANPDVPWHEVLNPYITVDWMPIDLTVFNGEEAPAAGTLAKIKFASRQKSGALSSTTNVDVDAGKTLYSYHCAPAGGSNTTSTIYSPHFPENLALEYVDNPGVSDTPTVRLDLSGASALHTNEFATLGYLNSRFGLRGLNGGTAPPAEYLGASVHFNGPISSAPPALPPVTPYWANRDFVNGYELMNVPLSSAGQLMQEFSATPGVGFNFQHVLDFDMTSGLNAALPTKQGSLLLELVAPRSPWVESEQIVDPNSAYSASGSTPTEVLANNALAIYRPPFNRFPTFVDRGRVNLNTVSQPSVFHGLMWSAMTPGSPSGFNRYGVSLGFADIPFAGDFRSSLLTNTPSSALPSQANPHLDGNLPTEFRSPVRPGVNATKTLPELVPAVNNNTASVGLLRPAGTTRVFESQKLYPSVTLPHNPLIYNSAASRLANLVTDHSNVYAVRVTVGYFEFDATSGLGAEYGLDEGKARRHRAFYLIDRSVPVGYQEGQDLNTDKCILMRRIIE